MNPTTFTIGEDKQSLVMERRFPAIRERVWDAYSKPELLAQWWGPYGWTTEIKHLEFAVGGYWHYCMRCEDKAQGDFYGMESWGKATYTEINPIESFSYVDVFSDEHGGTNTDFPASSTTVKLVDEGDQTLLVSTTRYDSPEALNQVLEMGMQEGFTQTLDRLETLLRN